MKKNIFTLMCVVISTTMVFAQGQGQTQGNGTGNGNSPMWRLDGNAGTDIGKPHFLGTLDNMHLAFRTNNTEYMRLTASGDVGIGIDVPVAKLHVAGSTQIDMDLNVDGNATIGMKTTTNAFRMPTGAVMGYVLMTDGNGDAFWETPDAFAQTLSWDFPTRTLSISSGNSVDLSGLIQALSLSAATNTLSLQEGGSVNLDKYDNGWTYGTGTNLFYTGNVAIGANNFASGYTLSVNGSIACEEVLVDLIGDWPDYVFAPEYELMSISDLANFVRTKNHLPGIPTAEEVAENGVELGQMQRMTIEKVEELTLYIIQQQEMIDELKREIEALKASRN